MTTAPKRGRPPDSGVARTAVVRLRLEPAAKEAWERAAEREDVSLTRWLELAAAARVARAAKRGRVRG